ncbi:survival motor neuron protein [Diaphorina citri]|jgi:Survival motor neuron protein (SMN).|uniref:Survival motor neuron protein n=1 Tax=Diaphorina citri TaxID=121845 RepID=A0A3Q0IUJ3_DIACI|nr:survival motor neuron protein [Diaphorina citri]KAI5692336.1 hypothetical protein M8J76_006038 [Diaphorina citri]KAI5702148.1 hypothetical protein M8J76_003625 [Diaphorina citri]KAI5704100.1 hypothetical protein M8J75_002011 [Diaphorina citri]KAI5736775.1 hypothetical protein M8J76_006952 [Diaphorina citri]
MSAGENSASSVHNNENMEVSNDEKNFNLKIDLIGQRPDDTELIDAYERAIKTAKEDIIKKRPDLKELEDGECNNENSKSYQTSNNNTKSKKKKGKGKKNKWSRGKTCRAVYSADNQEYEATICFLNPEQDECVVKFIGYGNKETVPLSSLKPSYGPGAVLEQKIKASAHTESTASELNESFYSPSSTCDSKKFVPFDSSRCENGLPPNMAMPPLPPPAFLAGQPLDTTESLSAVLMAWYMAGYHTGRYEASLGLNRNKTFGRP